MTSFDVQCLDIIQDSLEDCVVLELFGDVMNLRDAKEGDQQNKKKVSLLDGEKFFNPHGKQV